MHTEYYNLWLLLSVFCCACVKTSKAPTLIGPQQRFLVGAPSATHCFRSAVSTDRRHMAPIPKPSDLSHVPHEYHDFAPVFCKESALSLPPNALIYSAAQLYPSVAYTTCLALAQLKPRMTVNNDSFNEQQGENSARDGVMSQGPDVSL